GGVDPLVDRDFLDRADHALRGEVEDRRGRLERVEAERAADLLLDRGAGAVGIELLTAAEEVLRIEYAERQARVGHGQPCPASAVTARPRVGSGALRTDVQQPAGVDPGDRAAAGADAPHVNGREAGHVPEIRPSNPGLAAPRYAAAADETDVVARPA